MSQPRLYPMVLLVLVVALATPARAEDPRLRLYDGDDGATCRYFNSGARILWQHPLGDWRDAHDQAQGPDPIATSTLHVMGETRVARWDVTTMVRGWVTARYPNSGILLAPVRDTRPGDSVFYSREAVPVELRPRLTILGGEGRPPKILYPFADTWLNCSTAYALGTRTELHVGSTAHSALQFDLSGIEAADVVHASLELTPFARQSASGIGVFRLTPPTVAVAPRSTAGIASGYRRDLGIEKNPDVLLATGFESPSWHADWSYVAATSYADRVDRDDARKFVPFLGHALRVVIPRGDNFGLDMGFDFKDKLGYEPEEIYFRYYLRLGDDWIPTVDGGKLPGLAGTYGKAGWGGRRADPSAGWSMRGSFNRNPSAGNPLYGRTTIGTYAYHAAMEDFFGDTWYWTTGGLGVLERNRWYCLEQYFRVNTLGAKDGVLQAWVDGTLAFEKSDVYVRDLASIRIEKVWMNVYHGGTATPANDLHLYFDNVVVAKKPIGCIDS